ncbi:Hypothetical protein R9X50_00547500 [Acrodontium crateriforme]|uniref:Uncharacterized protein n=1 Tax=Acrodontium crateriforme TaxID=150365 RepID=A0AAQ3RBJ9_9PEZI|nr:Hypothetical protein R9X50_00547500 [Acrodontium crateriforme]
MVSTRVLSALGSADQKILAHQWRRSGQCLRCFHASTGRRAESEPSAAPKKSATRQQRAAKVSEEVSNLANSTPPPIIPVKPARSTTSKDSPANEKKAPKFEDVKPKAIISSAGRKQLDLAGKAFNPAPVTKHTFLRAGSGSATLAVPDLISVIQDQAGKAKDIWDPILHLQRRARSGHVITSQRRRTAMQEARNEATDRLVIGKIDKRLASDAPAHAQPVVGEVIKMALKNPTFLALDVDKFSNKVASLLPASSQSPKEEALKRQRERREKLQANAAKN